MAGQNFNSVLLTPNPKPIPLTSSLHPSSARVVLQGTEVDTTQHEQNGETGFRPSESSVVPPRSLEPGPRSVKDGTKGMTEAELSEQNPRRQELEDLYQQQFLSKLTPASGEVTGGDSPLRFCPVQLELVRRRGGHWSLGTSSFPAPTKAQKRGGEIHCLWFGGRGRAAHQASRPGC